MGKGDQDLDRREGRGSFGETAEGGPDPDSRIRGTGRSVEAGSIGAGAPPESPR